MAPPTATPPSSRGGATATPSSRAPDQGVMHTQLDIIMELAIAGVDPAALDRHKNSASYRACGLLETVFFEGSFLLGMCMYTHMCVHYRDMNGRTIFSSRVGWPTIMIFLAVFEALTSLEPRLCAGRGKESLVHTVRTEISICVFHTNVCGLPR